MQLELALRLSEAGLAFALLQRGAEHLHREPLLFAPQMVLALGLLVGMAQPLMLTGLWVLGLAQLRQFRGPYNGGADKMVLLAVSCVGLARLLPVVAEFALGYLAVQVVLSYVVSGWVKLRNPDWLSGMALAEVFSFSAYPVSENLRGWARRAGLMRAGSVAVIGFEVMFPLALLSASALAFALVMAVMFHLANAVFFGLNRFFWAWIGVFPSVLWLQGRLLG